jgi:uncharacterized protein YndB with AHSA1/START domain
MAARPRGGVTGSDRELVLTRIFDAPRRLVFKAWTDPVHAARWWGPQGFSTVSCDMDVRPGGAWRRVMRSPQGTLFSVRGTYHEVVTPKRLVFSYAREGADGILSDETLVTVIFADYGGKTELSLRQAVFETRAVRDDHCRGWASCFERFAEYLATL